MMDEKYEELEPDIPEDMNCYEVLLWLNHELLTMIEESINLELLARLLSTQLVTNGEKHLLDRNRTYYKLLRRIIGEGMEAGQLNSCSSVSEMVKIYAMSERALMYDWCLCGGEYSLRQYSASVLPSFLSSLLPKGA